MQDFRRLNVWQNAHRLALETYQTTRAFPKEELYGLTNQMPRCAVSIAANLAEGCGRGGDSDFARFVQIGMGSASELEYHLLLARDSGFVKESEHGRLTPDVTEVKRMLASLLKRLRTTK